MAKIEELLNEVSRLYEENRGLRAKIATLETNSSVTHTDTVKMPANMSLREKFVWCHKPREDGSGKLNRVRHHSDKQSKVEGDCIIWTGLLKGRYGKVRHVESDYRAHTLALTILEVEEDPIGYKDSINIISCYKDKTQNLKLVAAHQCPNKNCLNTDHLEWKDNRGNRLDSFYEHTQTIANETQQKWLYEWFINRDPSLKYLRDDAWKYAKSMGINCAVNWAYSLLRWDKYNSTKMAEQYAERVFRQWEKMLSHKTCKTLPEILRKRYG